MIASAIKVNVATAMPSENVTKLELYLFCNPYYSHGIPVYRKTTISQVLDTWTIMKSLVPKNYCDAVLVLHPNVTPSFEIQNRISRLN